MPNARRTQYLKALAPKSYLDRYNFVWCGAYAVSSLSRPVTARARGRGPMEARRWRGASGSRDAAVRHRPPSGLSTRSACAIGMLLLGLCGMPVHISISMGMRRGIGGWAIGPGAGIAPAGRANRTEPKTRRHPPPEPRKRQRPRPRPAGARRVRVSADSAPAVTTPVTVAHRRAVPCARGVRYAPRPPSTKRRRRADTYGRRRAAPQRATGPVRYRSRADDGAGSGRGRRGRDRPVGCSAEGARLVVFWGEQVRNLGGGAVALRAYEQSAPAGGYESYACMQDTYHKVNHEVPTATTVRTDNSYCGKRKRARRLLVALVSRACVRSPRKAGLSGKRSIAT